MPELCYTGHERATWHDALVTSPAPKGAQVMPAAKHSTLISTKEAASLVYRTIDAIHYWRKIGWLERAGTYRPSRGQMGDLYRPEDVLAVFRRVEAKRLEVARCKPMSDTDAAYLAGLFDGEGCFSVHRRYDGNRQHQVSYKAAIGMTHHEVIHWCAVTTGLGRVYFKPPSPGRRSQSAWHIYGREAAAIARVILPYLRVKNSHAKLLIELYDLMRSEDDPKIRRVRALQIAEEITALNHSADNWRRVQRRMAGTTKFTE